MIPLFLQLGVCISIIQGFTSPNADSDYNRCREACGSSLVRWSFLGMVAWWGRFMSNCRDDGLQSSEDSSELSYIWLEPGTLLARQRAFHNELDSLPVTTSCLCIPSSAQFWHKQFGCGHTSKPAKSVWISSCSLRLSFFFA